VSFPSLTISPATGASAGSRSQGGPRRRRVGGQTPVAPPTFSEDRFDGARISATRERPFRWAPHGSGPTAGPPGRVEPPDVSSSPQSCRAPPPAAGATTTLRRRGVATTRTTLICCSSRPPHWQHRHSTMARATGPHDCAHVTITAITALTKPPRLQWLQLQIKARERVFNSLTSSGATFGGCACAHPLRT
jgi:hypothetical protein